MAPRLIQENFFLHIASTPNRAMQLARGTISFSAVLVHRDLPAPGVSGLMQILSRIEQTAQLSVLLVGNLGPGETSSGVANAADPEELMGLLRQVC